MVLGKFCCPFRTIFLRVMLHNRLNLAGYPVEGWVVGEEQLVIENSVLTNNLLSSKIRC